MTPRQIDAYINVLEELNYAGDLNRRQIIQIKQVLVNNYIDDIEVESLHSLSGCMIPRDLKKIGEVLLANGVPLRCGICGRNIRKIGHFSIDHINPLANGGSNLAPNLQFSHNVCNRVKANRISIPSFYDVPELVAAYKASVEFQMLLEEIKIAMHIIELKPRAQMRPSSKCHHTGTWNSGDFARYNQSQRIR